MNANPDYSDESFSRSTNIPVDDVNSMHIVLSDNECSDVFFDEVCRILSEDGLNFSILKDDVESTVDSGVLITLDQQYNSGFDTLIFAPFDNTRLGSSDSLTLAMHAAFRENGFEVRKVLTGKVGFREDENGNVTNVIPTETEDAIDSNLDTSFITISLGTQIANAESVAKSIESGLARQKYYLDNHDSGEDLIYRSDAGEQVQVVADYFHTSVKEFCAFNDLEDTEVLDSRTIVNPNIVHFDSFKPEVHFGFENLKNIKK